MDDARPCYVEVSPGEWREGFVLRWYKTWENKWRAYVEWSEGPGLNHRETVAGERVKPRGIGPERPSMN